MTTFDRCLESLSFCHLQEERRWAAARVIAQQDIDAFIREQGPGMADKLKALLRLKAEFDGRFPNQIDPVLIRSYMRRHIRRIEYGLKRNGERSDDAGTHEVSDTPTTIPDMEPGAQAAGDMPESLEEMIELFEYGSEPRANRDSD